MGNQPLLPPRILGLHLKLTAISFNTYGEGKPRLYFNPTVMSLSVSGV